MQLTKQYFRESKTHDSFFVHTGPTLIADLIVAIQKFVSENKVSHEGNSASFC